MCRWAAWIGAPIYLETLITRPDNSLIAQSHHASECKTEVNADGFGVAWYGGRDRPGQFRDVYPAWSDPNLASLAEQISSGMFLAHVRASTGTATSRNNCHPFVVENWSFMHNGQLGGFDRFRRKADMLIPDQLYAQRKGATDSEVLFLLALAYGLNSDPVGALWKAIDALTALARTYGGQPAFRCAAALADGQKLYLLRTSSDGRAPTLYHRWDSALGGRIAVSEPLEQRADWTPVPEGTLIVAEGEAVQQHPFTLRQAA